MMKPCLQFQIENYNKEKSQNNKVKLIKAWIELRQEDLMADWSLAIKGEPIFKIDPLR